jgi:hypothetical protein
MTMAAFPPRRSRVSVRGRHLNRFSADVLGLMINLPFGYRRM